MKHGALGVRWHLEDKIKDWNPGPDSRKNPTAAQIRSGEPDRPIAFHKPDHDWLNRSRKYKTKQIIAN